MTNGERIKKRRKELDLSAEKLSARLGISPATMYRYENGSIEKIPGNVLKAIADSLHTTPEQLMGWTDDDDIIEAQNPRTQQEELVAFLGKLNIHLTTLEDEADVLFGDLFGGEVVKQRWRAYDSEKGISYDLEDNMVVPLLDGLCCLSRAAFRKGADENLIQLIKMLPDLDAVALSTLAAVAERMKPKK